MKELTITEVKKKGFAKRPLIYRGRWKKKFDEQIRKGVLSAEYVYPFLICISCKSDKALRFYEENEETNLGYCERCKRIGWIDDSKIYEGFLADFKKLHLPTLEKLEKIVS